MSWMFPARKSQALARPLSTRSFKAKGGDNSGLPWTNEDDNDGQNCVDKPNGRYYTYVCDLLVGYLIS